MVEDIKNKKIKEALSQFSKKKFLIVGDIMLDQYTFGDVSRISPEAPVPVLKETDSKFVPGGAGNVAANIAALGAEVVLLGVSGDDHNKDILFSILKDIGIRTTGIIIHKKRPTILKHRFVAGNNQQLLRVDVEVTDPLELEEEQFLLDFVRRELGNVDAVIFADYAKGVFSKRLAQNIIKLAKKQKKLIVADIKPQNKAFFQGVDIVTPNKKEAKEMAGLENLGDAGRHLAAYFESDIIITKSEQGMSIFKKNGENKDMPTKKIQVFDVSGAGDTVVAVVTLAISSGLDLESSAFLANYAGGLVVQKPGTATITKEELMSVVQEGSHLESVEIIPKVWGFEKWLENNEKYCSKLLSLNQGYQCSLHYHKVKDETFLVTKGHVRMEVGEKTLYMRQGCFVRITPGTLHRFAGIEDSEILEISTHHMEEDSYRLEESRKTDGKIT